MDAASFGALNQPGKLGGPGGTSKGLRRVGGPEVFDTSPPVGPGRPEDPRQVWPPGQQVLIAPNNPGYLPVRATQECQVPEGRLVRVDRTWASQAVSPREE